MIASEYCSAISFSLPSEAVYVSTTPSVHSPLLCLFIHSSVNPRVIICDLASPCRFHFPFCFLLSPLFLAPRCVWQMCSWLTRSFHFTSVITCSGAHMMVLALHLHAPDPKHLFSLHDHLHILMFRGSHDLSLLYGIVRTDATKHSTRTGHKRTCAKDAGRHSVGWTRST